MSRIEYSQLITDSSGGGKSTSRSFVFDLPSKEEAEGAPKHASGQIFGLVEIETAASKKSLSFIDALIQEIKAAATGSFGKPGQKSPEEVFENFIQKTNYRYLELVGGKSSAAFLEEDSDGLPKINAVLAFLDEKNLHLAGRGKMLPFLIYEMKPGNFRIMNITETAAGKDARSSKLSLFTNIVSGKIGANDYLFFTTESILDYFSLEKICKTVSAATPDEAKEILENLLKETANPGTSFAFMIMKLRSEIPVIKASPSPAPVPVSSSETSSPQNSMDGLLKTAADTEKMLTPSLGLNIGGRFSSFFGGLKNIFRKNEIKSNARLEYYSSQFHPPTSINKFFRSISLLLLAILRIPYFLVKILFSFLFNFLRTLFYLITNWKGQRKTAIANATLSFKKSWGNILPKTEKLPGTSKALLVFAIIFVVLFAGSTTFLYFKYQRDLAVKAIAEKVEVIQNKKSAAEANLIYNDEAGARATLVEIDTLLAAFPQKTKNEKNAYQNISGEVEVLREKLRHVVRIENPVAVVNFPGLNSGAVVDKFIVADNNIYAFDRGASVIYKINLQNNEVENQGVSDLNFQVVFMENSDSAFLYEPGKKFFKLDLKEDILKELEVVMGNNETEIQDLAVYNQKLYVLDPRASQIFRHMGTLTGFGGGVNWLRETVDIANAKSLAIDGAIYLGMTDGKILEFAVGKQIAFTPQVDPALSSEIKIWTSAESSFLYVLEPSTKRLVVLDKQGKLITQYFSEKFDNLKDFAIAEKEKKIYLLSGDFVYEVAATHLQ